MLILPNPPFVLHHIPIELVVLGGGRVEMALLALWVILEEGESS